MTQLDTMYYQISPGASINYAPSLCGVCGEEESGADSGRETSRFCRLEHKSDKVILAFPRTNHNYQSCGDTMKRSRCCFIMPLVVAVVTFALGSVTFVHSFSLNLLRPCSSISTVSIIPQQHSSSGTTFSAISLAKRGSSYSSVALAATSSSSSGGKKKRRRRKQSPETPTTSTDSKKESPSKNKEDEDADGEVVVVAAAAAAAMEMNAFEFEDDDEEESIDLETIRDVANFSFDGVIDNMDSSTGRGQQSLTATAVSADKEARTAPEGDDGAIPLPDIKDTLRRKELEAEIARMEEEQETRTKKIDRKDRQALLKLLEQQPYADADESFFEEEEYTTVSALLGERAKPFLGIPTGPLQVGHFIGALVIVLMAFIEYPGFPLTNLPSPLRGALQGGLGTVYAINTVLAVMAAFKAGERGQPAPLWIAKTFSVGGLAYDQLTQLPTLEQVEQAKARKGKRALKNKTKNKYY